MNKVFKAVERQRLRLAAREAEKGNEKRMRKVLAGELAPPSAILGPGLSSKQKRFIELFDGSNARAAALAAGYGEKHLAQAVRRLLTNDRVLAEIENREFKKPDVLINSKYARQRWFAELMENEALNTSDRLRAAELLGRSEGDFVDRIEHSKMTLEDLMVESYKEEPSNAARDQVIDLDGEDDE